MCDPGVYFPIFFSLFSEANWITFFLRLRQFNKVLPLEDAVDEFSAELICPYPPGIPIIIPGERLEKDRIDWLIEQKSLWHKQLKKEIRVVLK